ncbi:MAG: heavy metal-responsive transcriptional regulator [Candidatus Omnitrophica bacterium]|nr:heavy metal-responsive transcriptional regulator [Candidatus Omnitrophota bacterium]
MAKDDLLIGEVSRQTGVSIRTIRYYELEGLLSPSGRRPSGYRVYSGRDVERLRFIQQAKRFGLTLKEIRGIMRQGRQGLTPCCDHVRRLFNRKIAEFEGKIAELTATRDRLKERLRQWVSPKAARQGSYAICPQIESVKAPKTNRRAKR